VTRHGGEAVGTDGLAHGFVKQSCDDSAMQVALWALIVVRNFSEADNGAIFSQEEFEVQADRIGLAAPEAAILGGVRHWGKILGGAFHCFLDLKVRGKHFRIGLPIYVAAG
jgi:hypothetical protein